MNHLSSLNRSSTVEALDEQQFDLVIIGGGITGAGIALDASSRGLKVALIEKRDFASGTSSRSTKLIHGGLRYLKQLEIGLVREVGSERAIVHKLAPHLVVSEKMLLPLIDGGTYGKMATSFGLMVYDFLAGVESEDKRKMLSVKETSKLEPLLRKDILEGGGIYAEYRTDDARLTIEIIKQASKYGALSLNYIKAQDFIYNKKGKVTGVKCLDKISGKKFEITSKFVVSAAGPWVDKIRNKDNSLTKKHLYLTKGVHIVVPHKKLPVKQAVYFDVPDGRMIFTIPRQRVTYIGTTDTHYTGDINRVLTNQEDVDYLLDAVNNMFPDVGLKSKDVISSWAGLRPLIFEEGKSASELSRKDEIFDSPTGLISIAGGKLTGYRKMSMRVVDLVVKSIKKSISKKLKDCHTDQIELCGGAFKNAKKVNAYIQKVKSDLRQYGLNESFAEYLVSNYGKQTDQIIEKIKKYPDPPPIALARSELAFCIKNEITIKPGDFFSRRTGRLYFNIDTIKPVMDTILNDFKKTFNWDDAQLKKEKEKLQQELYESSHFEYSKEPVKK